jgi:periplasmic protein TonB
LREVNFKEETRNQNCVLGPPTPITGVMGSVISSGTGGPRRVRLPETVTQNLLTHRVEPHYPDDALKSQVQGTVVLKEIISENGDVETATFFSGDSTFTDAAIEAVKQWKYKPYLLDGNPIQVETKVTLSFTLPQ